MHALRLTKDWFLWRPAVVAIVLASACQSAPAQRPLQMPAPELSTPGVEQKSSLAVPPISSTAFNGLRHAEALTMRFGDAVPRTRGAQDIALFRDDAPSVVLIMTKAALGSGSLLADNVILTNFHVIDHNRVVTVVFKPVDPSGKPTDDEVVKADIVKIDVQRDLALIRPRSLPSTPASRVGHELTGCEV